MTTLPKQGKGVLRPLLYIHDNAGLAQMWAAAARSVLPAYEICTDLEGVDPARITVALVWKPPPGFLASLPNLRLVVCIGAGVDHIVLSDPEFPRHIPLVRMVDPGLTHGMCDYVVWACLSLLRRARHYAGEQAKAAWERQPLPPSSARRVLVLGLGEIGAAAARTLQAQGFEVSGWSRGPKQLPGIKTYAGSPDLPTALAQADILVNLLPATPQTQGLMDAAFFAHCAPGAAVVNAGRGATVDEEALLSALDAGKISAAVLDVFQVEPLPADHRFWAHPCVTVTPHNAAITHPDSGIHALCRAVEALEAGQPLPNLVDWERGY